MSGPELITLGCRLNIAESEAIRAGLGDADVIVVNSCAVTAEAVTASRRAIRKAARRRPEARIVVTGCASEIDRAMFERMAEVERVVPNAAKLDISLYADLPSRKMPAFAGMTGQSHARAFLPVQTGCDHRCTFCIIPYGRGASRSVPAGDVVAAARAAVEAAQREIVLTGVDLTAYGADLPGQPTLGLLVERLLRFVPRIERLRLSSLDAVEIDDRLFDLIAHEPRVMPHLHLSLQAGDDMILKRMKRRHARANAIRLVERVKAARPEVAIGADLIAGFPTESEAMFAGTLALLDDCDVVMPHIFPYSPREGTPAARMPQLEREVIRARAARLREAGAKRTRAWLEEHIGTVQKVLVELDGVSGHAEDFAKAQLRRPSEGWGPLLDRQMVPREGIDTDPSLRWDDVKGCVVLARITGIEGDVLTGVPA